MPGLSPGNDPRPGSAGPGPGRAAGPSRDQFPGRDCWSPLPFGGRREGEMQSRRTGNPPESFGSLPRALAEELAARATTRRYRRGEYICHAGEPATRLFVVDSGRIAIAVRARDGREVGGGRPRAGRALRRAPVLRRRTALVGRAGAHARAPRRGRLRRRARGDRREAEPAVGRHAHPHPPPARHRRGPRRRDVPRRHRPDREATAPDRGRRRRVLAPGHPGGARGDGRRVARTGQQGDRHVRAPRLAHGATASSVARTPAGRSSAHGRLPQDPSSRDELEARARRCRAQASGSAISESQAIARGQSAAASSARCTGRSGSWTKP